MLSTGSAALAPFEPRSIAERYQIEALLGRGGMGAVYAAFDPVAQKRVALKLLAADAPEGAVELFEREYHTLASLEHPKIVEVYEYGRCADGTYYTMELLAGSDLSKSAPMPWREVCACLREVASVVGLLHVRGLVHRDLSPRNLWRMPDGRLKLIDFGALAPFGPTSKLTGTPPFVPPEALRGLPLDARSDLYALGALGYWLLTSVHAYAAKSFGELHALWTEAPALPSNLVGLVAGPGAEPVPEALDELLLGLLRLDPERRIRSTAELIDRATAIAELAPDLGEQSAQGYLHSKAFVGRERERERLLEFLSDVERGTPKSLLVEAASGLGRTRLLAEMAIVARVAGATTLRFDARGLSGPYALARELLQRLTSTLPEARQAAEARADVLGTLLPGLSRISAQPVRGSVVEHSTARVRLQTALCDWLLEVAQRRTIALFVDDLQAADAESLSLLSLVARADSGHKLLLVSSILREGTNELSPLAQSLRQVSSTLRLMPLTRAETMALLRSVFGNVPYLERLAERFFRLSEGNPSHCLELCEHLVRVGAARYADGLWVLPTDLSTAGLPKSRADGIVGRLTQLAPDARALAANLSIPHTGTLPTAVCREFAGTDEAEADKRLAGLVQAGVLIGATATGYDFAHEALRENLFGELAPEQRVSAHRRMGDVLMRSQEDGNDTLTQLNAGLHYLRAGDLALGERVQVKAQADMLEAGVLDGMRRCVAPIEQGYTLLKAAGRDDYSLATHLTLLGSAGYHVDRRFGRYGDDAVATLARILRLHTAQALRPWLGAKLALLVALLLAGVGLARRGSRAPSLARTVQYLFFAASSLSGMAAVCLDGAAIRRYAAAIEPLAALGKDHAAGFIHQYLSYLAERMGDRPARTIADGAAILARLGSAQPIRGLPELVKHNYVAGALFSQGVTFGWRDGPLALEAADQVEGFSPFYAMCADHLRAVFHSGQGNMREAARYRQLVEKQAIQLGSAWQLETWGPADILKTASLTHDALMLKRAVQELERAAEELPSFGQHLRSARASYLLLRGKPREAIPLLQHYSEPLAVVGWTRCRGRLASAHNALGEFAEAKSICEDALGRLSPEDLMFPAMNMIVELELCIAETGLGNAARATKYLDRLLETHAPLKGPLTLGAIHDAYAQVAIMEKDFALAAVHLEQMEALYRPLDVPSLTARVEALTRRAQAAQRADLSQPEGLLLSDDVHLITRVQLLLTHSGELASERADKALQIAVELSGADDGFIVLQRRTGKVSAFLNQEPPEELVGWAHARLLAAYANDETAAVEDVNSLIDLNLKQLDGVRYCTAPLWARVGHEDVVVAVVALGFRNSSPKLPGADVLRVIASSLVDVAKISDRPQRHGTESSS